MTDDLIKSAENLAKWHEFFDSANYKWHLEQSSLIRSLIKSHEALVWLVKYVTVSDRKYVDFLLSMPDCPEVLRQLIEKEKER